jgi:hypothetical protein
MVNHSDVTWAQLCLEVDFPSHSLCGIGFFAAPRDSAQSGQSGTLGVMEADVVTLVPASRQAASPTYALHMTGARLRADLASCAFPAETSYYQTGRGENSFRR